MAKGPIGILGGIFDPVHNGHLSIAALARDFFHLDRVLFIPAGIPPHKTHTVTAGPRDRLDMLNLAVQNENTFEIWDGEILRDGYSYTVESLRTLKKTHESDLYFIIGSDNLNEIPTWREYREILKLVILCVASRPGYPLHIPELLSETGAVVRLFPSPEWGVSSTIIRKYLYEGFTCKYLVPDPVLEYIKSKRLYS